MVLTRFCALIFTYMTPVRKGVGR